MVQQITAPIFAVKLQIILWESQELRVTEEMQPTDSDNIHYLQSWLFTVLVFEEVIK